MPTFPAEIAVADTSAPPANPAPETKVRRWLELCLVVILAFGNSVFGSIRVLVRGVPHDALRTPVRWFESTAYELVLLALLVHLLSRSGRRLKDIGLEWRPRDAAAGVALSAIAYVSYFVGAIIVEMAFRIFGIRSADHGPAQFFGAYSIFAVIFTFVNPFFEELIVRAYLMTEIKALTGSARLAVAASTVIQTSYHLYYGWWTALGLGCSFLVFSLYFARSRRAAPLIVAHCLQDLGAILYLWLR